MPDATDATDVFEILMRENADMLLAFLRASVRDSYAVDDIFQETMIVAWRRLTDFDRSRSFGKWIRGIAGKLVLAHFRKAGRNPMSLDQSTLEWMETRFDLLQSQPGDALSEKLELLRECVAVLSDENRATYKVTLIINRPDHSKTTRRSDLFVNGAHKFAVRSSRDLGSRPIWMGSRNGKAWVVPAFGPVITGNRTNLSTWVSRSEEASTPYLHVTTILERMRDSYTLSAIPDETINTANGDFDCAHTVAILANDEPRLPNRIELWTDTDSGVAIKVLATWDLADNESGRQSLLVELKENTDLADAFFTPNEHGGQNRPRINFGSDDY